MKMSKEVTQEEANKVVDDVSNRFGIKDENIRNLIKKIVRDTMKQEVKGAKKDARGNN